MAADAQTHLDKGLDPDIVRYINLKLSALAEPVNRATADPGFMEIVAPLLRNHTQKDQLLGWPLCPVDARLQAFHGDSPPSSTWPPGIVQPSL